MSQDLKEMREPSTLIAEDSAFWAGETADVEACSGGPAAHRKNKKARVTAWPGGGLSSRM